MPKLTCPPRNSNTRGFAMPDSRLHGGVVTDLDEYLLDAGGGPAVRTLCREPRAVPGLGVVEAVERDAPPVPGRPDRPQAGRAAAPILVEQALFLAVLVAEDVRAKDPGLPLVSCHHLLLLDDAVPNQLEDRAHASGPFRVRPVVPAHSYRRQLTVQLRGPARATAGATLDHPYRRGRTR